MLAIKSKLTEIASGFASFLSFMKCAVFPIFCLFIFLSLPELSAVINRFYFMLF
jgi:hypothetical protein